MPWRNGLDNPTLHDFLDDLASSEVRNRTLFELFTHKGDQLAELLRSSEQVARVEEHR